MNNGHSAPVNRVGVIGYPVAHSLSPAMHNAAFAALGMRDWHYALLPIAPEALRNELWRLRDEGYVGVNVTVPHKQTVMPYVVPDVRARAVGAINTIDFKQNIGTNTDVMGFIDDLIAHDIYLGGETVLVLGAGGAARAAVFGLAQAGAEVLIYNRTAERAEKLISELDLEHVTALSDLSAAHHASLIVNCTSVGMWPNAEQCPWPDDAPFPEGTTVYDMIYRPEETRLMQIAEARDGRAIGGLGMLVRQGAAAFHLWTGQQPPLDAMFNAARTILEQERPTS